MNQLCGCNIITRAHIRGRQEGQSDNRKRDERGGERVRLRFEDAIWLVLKMEEGGALWLSRLSV